MKKECTDSWNAALELHRQGFSVEAYINGVQAERKKRLETFIKLEVKELIDAERELVQYGEEVISKMKLLNLIKFMRDESVN